MMIMYKAIIERDVRSLQVFAFTEASIRDQIKAWVDAKILRNGEEIKLYKVHEELMEKFDREGMVIK